MFIRKNKAGRLFKNILYVSFVSLCLSNVSFSDDTVQNQTRAVPDNDSEAQRQINDLTMSQDDINSREMVLEAAKIAINLKINSVKDSIHNEDNNVENKKIIPMDAVERLMGIYESMKPSEAASIFNLMDTHVLIALAANMKTRKLAAIMAQMNPDRVNMITQYIIGVKHFKHDNNQSFIIPIQAQDSVNLTNAQLEAQKKLLPSRQ